MKISNIILVVLFMVSGIVIIGFYRIGLFSFYRQIDDRRSVSLEGIDEIQVNMLNEQVHIFQTGTGDDIELHYYGKSRENIKLHINRNDNRMVVEAKDGSYLFSRGFFKTSEELYLDIYLPETFSDNLSIDTSSGSVMADPIHLTSFILNISSGKLEAEEMITEKIFIKTSSGKVHIKKIETDDLEVVSSSSSIDIKECNAKSGTLKTSSGSITLDESVGSFKVKTSSGRVAISYKEFEDQELFIETSSGKISLELPISAEFMVEARLNSGKFKTDFSMDTAGDSGEKVIKGQVGTKDNPIILKTSSGNINLMKK